MKRKKLLIAVLTLIIIGLSLIICFLVAQHKILYHYAVVDAGKVYRSGTLSELGLKWAKQRSGFKTIINVRSEKENAKPWHQKEAAFAKKNQVRLIDIPLQSDTPPSAEQIKKFLKIVRNPENLPVIIHCHQGVTRTAMMVAVYEIAVLGKDNKQVYKSIETFHHSFDKADKSKVRKFILTFGKNKL